MVLNSLRMLTGLENLISPTFNFVILAALYPLVLTVTSKFGVYFHLIKMRTLLRQLYHLLTHTFMSYSLRCHGSLDHSYLGIIHCWASTDLARFVHIITDMGRKYIYG